MALTFTLKGVTNGRQLFTRRINWESEDLITFLNPITTHANYPETRQTTIAEKSSLKRLIILLRVVAYARWEKHPISI